AAVGLVTDCQPSVGVPIWLMLPAGAGGPPPPRGGGAPRRRPRRRRAVPQDPGGRVAGGRDPR
ncbi:hypothetical protein, partial [Achromobacter xylosoxidans]|uniref:hypothetical protein n=1 Tax=Alcaligenes xylosoxydans xylosoxydans TaxID=85698 RepID=UPI0023677B73